MPRFLLPVDFSGVSTAALKYLLAATDQNDRIDLLHVDAGIVSLTENPVIHNLQQHESAILQKMASYFSDSLNLDSLPPRCELSMDMGEIVGTIIKKSHRETHYDLIVMGLRDKFDLLDKWLGTVALGVVKRSDIPVLLIPLTATFKAPEACIVAGDAHLTDQANLEKISEWNKTYKSHLHFVHVSNKNSTDYKDTLEHIIKTYYEENVVDFGFDVTRVEDDDISHALLEKAMEYAVQMIVILPDKQSFLNALFMRSISKELILRSTIPLMFLK